MARTKQTAKKLEFAPKKVARLGKKAKKAAAPGGLLKDALPKKARSVPVTTSTGHTKRPHRWRSGTVAKRKVVSEQKNAWKKYAIRKLPFQRMLRNALVNVRGGHPDVRVKSGVVDIVQTAVEDHMIKQIDKAYRNCLFYKRVMLRGEDIAHHMSIPKETETA